VELSAIFGLRHFYVLSFSYSFSETTVTPHWHPNLIKTEFSKKNWWERERRSNKSARKYLAYLPGAED